MKNVALLLEQLILAVTWITLYEMTFSKARHLKPAIKVLFVVVIGSTAYFVGNTDLDIFIPLLNITVGCFFNGIGARRCWREVIAENISSYMITRFLWLGTTALSLLIFNILHLSHDIWLECLSNCILQLLVCIFLCKCVDLHKWEIFLSKYSLLIITIAGAMFAVSLSIIIMPYIQQKREVSMLASVVITGSVAILLIWVRSEYQRQQEEAAQLKHIEELVRDAHQYKEVIPAVEWKLITMRDAGAAGEHNWAMAEELGIAIEEVRAMRRGFSRESVVKLAEEQDFTSTGLLLLDGQLQMKRQEAAGEGIAFDCVVTSPAAVLVKEGVLDQFRLQQVIGDLLRNALRAIRAGGGEDRRMLLVLGETREGYQIKLCDTGLPFPEEVLRNFGRRGLTTGGSGHGLADLCEIMAQCGGSIQVTEHEAGSFTKTITLTMDGRAVLSVSSPLAGVEYVRSLVPEAVGEGSP